MIRVNYALQGTVYWTTTMRGSPCPSAGWSAQDLKWCWAAIAGSLFQAVLLLQGPLAVRFPGEPDKQALRGP